MSTWGFIKKYVFTVDFIMWFVIFVLVIYFIYHAKKKVFHFQGLDPNIQNIDTKLIKKKKKRVNKHEEECRSIFQDIFRVKFKSCRPDFLKNPVTGKNLELDGFNSTIKTKLGTGLAFEYDGEQHSIFNKHFHRNGPDEFVYQVKKDNYKDLRCKQEGILLIRIPHFVNFNDLPRYIKQELNRQGVLTPGAYDSNLYEKFVAGENIYS